MASPCSLEMYIKLILNLFIRIIVTCWWTEFSPSYQRRGPRERFSVGNGPPKVLQVRLLHKSISLSTFKFIVLIFDRNHFLNLESSPHRMSPTRRQSRRDSLVTGKTHGWPPTSCSAGNNGIYCSFGKFDKKSICQISFCHRSTSRKYQSSNSPERNWVGTRTPPAAAIAYGQTFI